MMNKRLLSLLLALLMVLTILPTAIAETTPQTDPDVVYGYSIGGEKFYACDSTGVYDETKPIDPNTITHLFLQAEESWGFHPLRLADRTNLRWVKAIVPSGYSSCFHKDVFSGYVNLEEIIFPENIDSSDIELFKNTALRSFTLPKVGVLDENAFQGCTTIEEIINPSEQDVTLQVHFEDITIPAGRTWHAEFGVHPTYYYSTPEAPLSIKLNAFGADGVNPVVWSFTESTPPEGFALTEDGVLTGSYPANPDEFKYVFVTATNGDKSADALVYLESFNGVTVTAELSDWVTLQDGPVGEKALDTHAPAIYSFALTDAVPEGYSLFGATLTEVSEYGEVYDLSSSHYSLRDNVLYLDAEAISYDVTQLIVKPLIGRDFDDAVKTAPAITFPYQELLDEDIYPHTDFPDYDASEYKAYKAQLSMGDKMNVSLLNQEDKDQDTRIFVYYEDDYGNPELLTSIDKDAVGFGEQSAFYATHDDTYYIFATCYKDSTLTGCTFTADVEKETIPIPENAKYTNTLWFNDEENPLISHPDDLWAWDNDTKTLTLKDGFTLKSESGEGIVLPEQSTLIVEGKATIMAEDDGIQGLGDLTIELKDKADLVLVSVNDYAIDLDEGLLKVTGDKKTAKLSAYALGDDGIYVSKYDEIYDETTDSYIPTVQNGHIEMSNLTLYVLSEDDALQVNEGNITLTDCNVTIESSSDGFLIDYYLDEPAKATITLTGCKLNLVCDNQAIKNYCGGLVMTDCDANIAGETPLYISGAITVTGGRMIAKAANHNPIICVDGDFADAFNNVTFSNVAMQLQINNDWIFEGLMEHVFIESPYGICLSNDVDGIVYMGDWDEQTYFNLIDEGKIPTRLQSLVCGDIDGDLAVSAADALMALKSVVGKVELTEYETLMGDVNGDEKITAEDALLILKKVVGKIDIFPVEESVG